MIIPLRVLLLTLSGMSGMFGLSGEVG